MPEYHLIVPPEDAGKRLDIFLNTFASSQKLGFSRTFIQSLIADGKVTSTLIPNPKSHHKIKAGEGLRLSWEEKKEHGILSEDIPLEVVYEDEELAIINKPTGLVVHPASGNASHTLVNALLHRFGKLSDINPQRPGIVHRLDKDTSGLLVIARNNSAHLHLAKQFAAHSIERTYVALVKGKMEFDENYIEAPIGRDPYHRKNMSVGFGEHTKSAKTYYKTLARSESFSMVELHPFTGRTHQLRVHLAFIGHPILGDVKYGRQTQFPRLALHACSLGFEHPATGKLVEFSSPIPQEFNILMRGKKS